MRKRDPLSALYTVPDSLPIDYYTAAKQTWPNENSDLLASPVGRPQKTVLSCCSAARLPVSYIILKWQTQSYFGRSAKLQESVGLKHTQMTVCPVWYTNHPQEISSVHPTCPCVPAELSLYLTNPTKNHVLISNCRLSSVTGFLLFYLCLWKPARSLSAWLLPSRA